MDPAAERAPTQHPLCAPAPGEASWETSPARVQFRGRDAILRRLTPLLSRAPDFQGPFFEELRRASTLIHGNVHRVHEFGQMMGSLYLIQEDFDGAPAEVLLAECRRRRVPLPIPSALFLAREVASALAYAHDLRARTSPEASVVHGAVTVANVLLSRAGDVKLGGFGIWRAIERAAFRDRFLDGLSLARLAPEMRRGERASPPSDIYGCVSVLYELLTFRRPGAFGSGEAPPPSAFRRGVAPEIDELCALALREAPQKRRLSASELEKKLTKLLLLYNPFFTADDLAAFLDGLTADREEEPTIPETPTGRDLPRLRLVERGPGLQGGEARASEPAAPPLEEASEPLVLRLWDGEPDEAAELPAPPRRRSRRAWVVAIVSVGCLLGAGAAVWGILQERPEATEVRASSAQPVPIRVLARLHPKAAPGPAPKREPARANPATMPSGYFSLTADRWTYVSIGGQPRIPAPLTKVRLPAGRHTVELFNPADRSRRRLVVTIRPNETSSHHVKWGLSEVEPQAGQNPGVL